RVASGVLGRRKAVTGWAGDASKATQVALDVRTSPELASDGWAREAVRGVNHEPKNARLDLEDRIELYLGASSDALREAIREHRDYLAAETLVGRGADEPLTGPCHRASGKLDGHPLPIALRKPTPL